MKLQNKVLYFSILLIFIIFSISLINADETDVIITGMKGYVFDLTVNMVKADSGDLIQAQENKTEASTGIAKFKFSSASQMVSFYIIVRSNGKILTTKKPAEIGNHSTGAYVYIDLFPTTQSSTSTTTTTTTQTTITEVTTETDTNDTSDENTTAESSIIIDLGSKVTEKASEIYGKVKSGFKVALPWILWGLLGLAVLAGLIFGGLWIMKRNKRKYLSGTKRYEDLVGSGDDEKPANQKKIAVKKKDDRGFEEDLERAEEKIKEAQEEIAKIKNRKNRLSQAQANYEKAKRELEDISDEEKGEDKSEF